MFWISSSCFWISVIGFIYCQYQSLFESVLSLTNFDIFLTVVSGSSDKKLYLGEIEWDFIPMITGPDIWHLFTWCVLAAVVYMYTSMDTCLLVRNPNKFVKDVWKANEKCGEHAILHCATRSVFNKNKICIYVLEILLLCSVAYGF